MEAPMEKPRFGNTGMDRPGLNVRHLRSRTALSRGPGKTLRALRAAVTSDRSRSSKRRVRI